MVKVKITSASGLATTSTLHAVENNILNTSEIVNKTDYDAEISHINTKFFTTSGYNKFASEIVKAKIKNGVVDEYDIFEFIKNSDLDKKIATLAVNAELKSEQDKIVKLQTLLNCVILVITVSLKAMNLRNI